MALPLLVRLLLRRVALGSVLLRLRLVISVASVVSAAAHQLPVLSPLTASALAASQRPEQLLPEASAALALLRLRQVASGLLPLADLAISEASVDLAGLVVLLPDLRLSLVLMQVSDLALFRLRPVASGALPLADLAISEASVDLAGLATLPLLAPLRLRS